MNAISWRHGNFQDFVRTNVNSTPKDLRILYPILFDGTLGKLFKAQRSQFFPYVQWSHLDILNPNLERFVGRPNVGITHIMSRNYPAWKTPGVGNDFLLGMESELDAENFHENRLATIVDLRNLWYFFPIFSEERSETENKLEDYFSNIFCVAKVRAWRPPAAYFKTIPHVDPDIKVWLACRQEERNQVYSRIWNGYWNLILNLLIDACMLFF